MCKRLLQTGYNASRTDLQTGGLGGSNDKKTIESFAEGVCGLGHLCGRGECLSYAKFTGCFTERQGARHPVPTGKKKAFSTSTSRLTRSYTTSRYTR